MAKGTDGHVLTLASGLPSWAAPGGGASLALLASVVLGSAATTLSSGTITAKKNLKITIFVTGVSAAGAVKLQFNGDTAGNYRMREGRNGGTFADNGAEAGVVFKATNLDTTDSNVATMDIVNISNKVKFGNGTGGTGPTAGGGALGEANAYTFFWNNTSAQITSVILTMDGTKTMGGRHQHVDIRF